MATLTVNEVAYDFQSLEVEVSFKHEDKPDDVLESMGIIDGIEEMSYTHTRTRAKMYGRSRKPKKKTPGIYEFEASCTIHRDHFDFIIAKAKSLDIPLDKLSMNWAVTYTNPASEKQVVDTLTDVSYASIENTHSQGEDGLIVPIELDPLDIYYDGVDPLGFKI